MINAKRWMHFMLMLFTLILLGIGVFNFIVDPYGYFSRENKYLKNLTLISKPEILNTKLYSDAKMYIIV